MGTTKRGQMWVTHGDGVFFTLIVTFCLYIMSQPLTSIWKNISTSTSRQIWKFCLLWTKPNLRGSSEAGEAASGQEYVSMRHSLCIYSLCHFIFNSALLEKDE